MTKISRVLRDNLFTRRSLTKSGRLEFNRLSKFGTSNKLFSTATGVGGKKYNVHILLDVSGSTYNFSADLFRITKNVVQLLKHVCHIDIDLFNCSMYSMGVDEFMSLPNSFGERTMQYPVLYKEVSDGPTPGLHLVDPRKYIQVDSAYTFDGLIPNIPNDITDGMSNAYPQMKKINQPGDRSNGGDGNCDMNAVQYAYNNLKNKEGTNIIIVVSDGAPSLASEQDNLTEIVPVYVNGKPLISYNAMGGNKKLGIAKRGRDLYRKFNKDIESKVELVGIGYRTNAPIDYFSNFVRVENPDEVFNYMVLLFERLIKEGK